MPVPDLPQALSKGTVEGALVPFEILEPLKLHQLTDVSVEGAGGDRFGTSVFMFAMNKDRYDSLAPELQRVIDANSGRALAKEMGAVWNRVERRGKELQRSSGGRVIELTPEQTAAFETLSRSVTQRWIDQAEARGIAAETLVERAKAAVERHSD
jgi:TRAP-type C4-dicarboxylate transport system substrate-binding protein